MWLGNHPLSCPSSSFSSVLQLQAVSLLASSLRRCLIDRHTPSPHPSRRTSPRILLPSSSSAAVQDPYIGFRLTSVARPQQELGQFMVQSLRTCLRLFLRRGKAQFEEAPPSYNECAPVGGAVEVHPLRGPASQPSPMIILAFKNGQKHLVAQPSSFVAAKAVAHILSSSLAGRSFHFEILFSNTGTVTLHNSSWSAALQLHRKLERGDVPVVHVVQDPPVQRETSSLSLPAHLSRRRGNEAGMRQVFVTRFEARTVRCFSFSPVLSLLLPHSFD